MKKIGLVTWYDRGPNYGTILQAYSLQKNIEKLGYDCEIIKYKNTTLLKKIKRIILYVLLLLFKNKLFRKHIKMLKWIRNNLKTTQKIRKYSSLKEKAKEYDACVCGSDQIWSTAEEKIDPFYYLQFINKERRIAYAPSIGKDNIGITVKDKFIDYVSQIPYLSVREKRAADVIKNEANLEAKVVLDPTLLLTRKNWQQLLRKNEEQKYVFVYFLSRNDENYHEVEKFAKNNRLQIISTAELYKNFSSSKSMDPIEFLEQIKNTKYAVTDSFHGPVFSIIFEKQFVVYKRFKDNTKISQNSRIYNLLDMLEMQDRLKSNNGNIENMFSKAIDYKKVEEKLEIERKKSLYFLKKSLEQATK